MDKQSLVQFQNYIACRVKGFFFQEGNWAFGIFNLTIVKNTSFFYK